MLQKMKPLGARVLIKRMESESTTKSGIIIPDSAKEKAQLGQVLAVGTGRLVNGVRVAVEVTQGDTVFFSKYAGTDVDGDRMIIDEDQILGVVEKQ